MAYFNFIILIVMTILLQTINSQIVNTNWKDPSVMNRGSSDDKSLKNVVSEHGIDEKVTPLSNLNTPVQEDHVSTMIFRRIVKYLFNQEKFEQDPKSDHFIRRIPLRVTANQFQALQKTDIRDLDDVMSQIFEQSQNEFLEHPFEIVFAEIYIDSLLSTIKSIFYSTFGVFLIILLGIWIVYKTFHFSKLTLSMVASSAFFVIIFVSYVMNYMECNDELEASNLIVMESADNQNNPCQDYEKETSTYFKIQYWIFGSSRNACEEHKKKIYKSTKVRYCNPTEVLISWIAKLQTIYIEKFTKNLIIMVNEITKSSGFFSKIVCIFGIAIITVIIILVTIKSFMKYGFKSFVSYIIAPKHVNDSNSNSRETEQLAEFMKIMIAKEAHSHRSESSILPKPCLSSSRLPTLKINNFGGKSRSQHKKKSLLQLLKKRVDEDSF